MLSKRSSGKTVGVAFAAALLTLIVLYHISRRRSISSILTSSPLRSRILSPRPKVNAAFVMLVQNKDVYGAVNTIRQIEDRFNLNYRYPYVFLNDKPFTQEFMGMMKKASKAEMTFGVVPVEHWSYPDWISKEQAAEARERMRHVIYGSSESYRHMCRYQSGFISQHDALLQYDYYWRIEPDVKYSCDLDFDPFRYMQENGKNYAFTISIYEYAETVVGLWDATKEFMEKYPHLLAENNALDLISDDGGKTYNNCHFWSNFEIVDTRWMRSDAFRQFFDHLDHHSIGGFFYQRWGDAPVHTIAAALLLPIDQIHFFREIGYYHNPFFNCPAEPELQSKCHCDPALNVNRERFTCTAKFLELSGAKRMVYPEELDDYYEE
ncbi:alpha 1,2-mannosyltransferase 2.4.1 [Dissophora globulifera]|uniref:Alpha 1,2-mannosyltransferase 2.4.1 n=1 Tax=Dissophora globulifera TaxID=979702 RepID=A0A9P6R8X8_9FUNG|nr:alpha 1,2-mannosyltransferase 2.4.1 [Dissophora globulifera]